MSTIPPEIADAIADANRGHRITEWERVARDLAKVTSAYFSTHADADLVFERDSLRAIFDTLATAQSIMASSPAYVSSEHEERLQRIIDEVKRHLQVPPDSFQVRAEPTPEPRVDSADLPHSRACGLFRHGHGAMCVADCPTCHGGGILERPTRIWRQTPFKNLKAGDRVRFFRNGRDVLIGHEHEDLSEGQIVDFPASPHIQNEVQVAIKPSDKADPDFSATWGINGEWFTWYVLLEGDEPILQHDHPITVDCHPACPRWSFVNERTVVDEDELANVPDAAEFAAMQREIAVPCGNATDGLPISECQKREEGCVCFPAEPQGPVEKIAYWAKRILENDGALSAGSSMDLDMAHDELAKAVRAYLGLPGIQHESNPHAGCGVVIADIPGDVQATRSHHKDGSEWSQEWRQVAWYGLSTGIVYGLHDEARLREDRAGFGGLWMLAHNDRVEKGYNDEMAELDKREAESESSFGEIILSMTEQISASVARAVARAGFESSAIAHRFAQALEESGATTADESEQLQPDMSFAPPKARRDPTVESVLRATASGLGLDPDKAVAELESRLRQNAQPTTWVAVCPFCWEGQDPSDPLRGSVSVPVERRAVAAGVAESHNGEGHRATVWTTRRLENWNRTRPLPFGDEEER